MNFPRLFPRLFLVAGIAGAVVWAGLNREQFDPTAMDAWLSGLGIWVPVVYVTLYAAGTVAFLPGSMFALAGGALFGPVGGAILNLLGASIGAGIAFIAARYIASDWVERQAAGRLKRLIQGVDSEGWRFVAFVRLVPLFPFNLTNYALGHIPGAVNIPLADLGDRLDALRTRVPDALIVVCRTDKRSELALTTLREAGFGGASILRGGMERWNALGFETVWEDVAGLSMTAEEYRT